MEKKGISIQEAALLTGFSQSTLSHACETGEIKAHKEDLHHWTINAESLSTYAAKHRTRKRTEKQKSIDQKGFTTTIDANNGEVKEIDEKPVEAKENTPVNEKTDQKSESPFITVKTADPVTKKSEDAALGKGLQGIFRELMYGPEKESWMDKPIELTYRDLQAYGDMRFMAGMRAAREDNTNAEED